MHRTRNIDQVLDLEARRTSALIRSDLDGMAVLLADDLRYVHSTGVVQDRQAYLAYLGSGIRFLEVSLSDVNATEVGAHAVLLTGRLALQFIRAGADQPSTARTVVTLLWRRQGAAWQLALLQSTREVEAS